MLEVVKINNLALISKTTLEFGKGFNVLTGETGAGKSLIIDALLFLTGIRADKTFIKSGEEYARVEGVFSVDENDEAISEILTTVGIENEGTLIISRHFSMSGKNECRINGELVTLNILRKVANEVLDIFGQNDSQILLNPDNHLSLFDSVFDSDLAPLKDILNVKLLELKDINDNIKLLGGLDKDRDNNIALLSFQIDEIEKSNLYVGEDDEIKNKLSIMQNMEKIHISVSQANDILAGDINVSNSIKSAINQINNIVEYDSEISNTKDRLYSIKYELDDIISELYTKLQSLDYSEEDFDKLQDRLTDINDLKRKYGNSVEDILNKKIELQEMLDKLLNSQEEIERLRLNKNKLLSEITKLCRDLRRVRQEKGIDFSKNLVSKLRELGMKNASFGISYLNEISENDIESIVTCDGADKIEFLFSANLGVQPKPLTKIISGGEMSRFMLAFKTLTNNSKKTCIFDEIDSGIGGEVGVIVGKKICEISRKSQVICITHLAQIASFGDQNYKIIKYEDDDSTITKVSKLDDAEKVFEIARMLGNSSNETAYNHAKTIVEESVEYKCYLCKF